MRHCANVSPQPQVQCSELSCSSTFGARLGRERRQIDARNLVGLRRILDAHLGFLEAALSSSSASTISSSGAFPESASVSSSVRAAIEHADVLLRQAAVPVEDERRRQRRHAREDLSISGVLITIG